MDFILIPLHIFDEGHWALAAVNFVRKRIQYFDSLISVLETQIQSIVSKPKSQNVHLNRVKRWVDCEHKYRKDGDKMDWRDWTYCIEPCPSQDNFNDCGAFMCMIALHIASLGGTTPSFRFSHIDMPSIRYWMIHCILNGKYDHVEATYRFDRGSGAPDGSREASFVYNLVSDDEDGTRSGAVG
eukprot:COSAG01_NODE_10559_length_2133_cov_1.785644_4_plen_184_part_00